MIWKCHIFRVRSVLLPFIFINQIFFVAAQLKCRTPLKSDGYCINLLNCQSLLNILKQTNSYAITYLQSATCGFDGIYPLVCCGENGQPTVIGPTETAGPIFSDDSQSNQIPAITTPMTDSPPITISEGNIPTEVVSLPHEVDPPEEGNTSGTVNLPETSSIPETSSFPETSFADTGNTPKTKILPTSTSYSLLRTPNCGISKVINNRVVNGHPAKLGEFPWMAALGYKNSKNPNIPRWLCAGTLITDKHVLTAGHCTYNRTDLYIVRLGDLDLLSDNDGATPVDVLIDSMKIHEQYDPGSITNDIAIITLASPVSGKHISPICLPLDEPLRSQNFVRYYPFVAGWGSIYYDGPASSHLMVVMLPVVSNEQCKQAFRSFKKAVIDDRSICAGYATGGKDACQGDSGGPLMLVNGRNPYSFYQIGIVSYGYRCAEVGIPGVYTRVTYFMNWIENNVI